MFDSILTELVGQRDMDVSESFGVEPEIWILDTDMARHVRVSEIVSFDADVFMNEVGQARLVVPATSMWAGVTVGVHPDASIPVVVQWTTRQATYRQLWFTTHVAEVFQDGEGVIELHLVSPEAHLEHLFAWVTPNSLPEFQIRKTKLTAGPVAMFIKEKLLRPQFDRVNAKNGTILGGDTRPAHVVAPLAPEDMHTRATLTSWKFDQVLDVLKALIDTEGLTLSARAYIHGVDEQPWRGANLRGSCVIWDVEQRAALPGDGWILHAGHGLINSVSDLWSTVWDFVTGYTDTISTQSVEATKFWGKPRMLLRAGQYSRCEVITQKPTASMFTVGGQSPEWLNNLLGMGISALISAVVPVLGIVANVTGLSNVMKDRIGSYHSHDDWERRKRMGRFGFIETFSPTTALTLDALFEIRRAQWKSRATRSYNVTFEPGMGLAIGDSVDRSEASVARELKVGSMVALELPGDRVVVAFVTKIGFSMGPDIAPQWQIQIGDRAHRDPTETVYRGLRNVALLANKLMLTEH